MVGVTKVYLLTEVDQLNAKKTFAHDDVTHGAIARKILKKIIVLANESS